MSDMRRPLKTGNVGENWGKVEPNLEKIAGNHGG